ncbi:MAG: ABC-2 transporter permease [Clostridia bacterium]|nr:ABC-2 transporter permease [Clostridia bacterium]
MKGLLLKDWYMMKKYCRAYLLIAVVFIAVSFFNAENMFFVFYPCLLCSMIPVNLLAYDERSRWMLYSCTLPCSKAQLVSAKYLIGLFSQAAILLATAVAQGMRMALNGCFQLQEFVFLLMMLFTIATISSSISMPFVFKLGVEKGRIAYYVMIGFVCAASIVASKLFQSDLQAQVRPNLPLTALALAGVGAYALSWALSIRFYQKREL